MEVSRKTHQVPLAIHFAYKSTNNFLVEDIMTGLGNENMIRKLLRRR